MNKGYFLLRTRATVSKAILLVLTSFVLTNVYSQNLVNLFSIPNSNNGTSINGRGPTTQSLFNRTATLYLASEINPFVDIGDSIASLGWNIATAAGSAISGTIKIYIANTSDVTFTRSTTWSTLLTTPTVMDSFYVGPMTIPNVAGFYSVNLSKKFAYTGGGLYIAYEWNASSTGTAAVYNCNTSLINGLYNYFGTGPYPTALPNVSPFRAQMRFGVLKRKKDASVDEIYTLGKLPIPYAVPHIVRTRVSNMGLDTLFNLPVTLTVTGANAFTNTQIVDTLLRDANRQVSFSGFSPSNIGNNIVTISVPNDSTNINNSKSYNQIVNLNTYNYADPTLPAIGGVGFPTGRTGDLAAKFPYTGSNSINQIGVNFFNGGQNVSVGIWDTSATGTPGTLLWSSAPFTTLVGANTIPVNPPVSISGSFFVGVRQINPSNVNFSYQNENPIRTGVFYFIDYTATTPAWADFAPNNPFKFMIEPRLLLANDIGASAQLFPCRATVQNGNAFQVRARFVNYGSNNQTSSFKMRCLITGPVNSVDSFTFSTNFFAQTSNDITFPKVFNPTTNGVYTIKVFSDLPTDGDRTNDTITSTFTVADLNFGTTAVNRIQFDSTDDYLQAAHASSLSPSSAITIEAWVSVSSLINNRTIVSKDSTKAIRGYNLYVNTIGNLVFVVNTTNGMDSVVSSTILPTATLVHVAAVYSGTAITLYINGNAAGTKSLSGLLVGNTRPLNIGRFTTGGELFHGTMDEIKIWNIARTASQIRSGMHTRLANSANANLVLYLRADEGVTTNYLTDASGNCNSPLMNNMDFNNTSGNTNTFAWIASPIPLGTPVVNTQTVTSSGNVVFTGTNLQMNFANYSGNEDYVVHYLAGQPSGTLPSTSPGGVTNVHNNYWMIYKFGTATYDSISPRFTFAGNSLISTSVASDLRLFRRANSSNGAWTLKQSGATAINIPSQNATFRFVNNDTFNTQFSIGANNGALPVVFLQFNAYLAGTDGVLNWSTASEKNNSYFNIERSTDRIHYESVGQVNGSGNSNEVLQYFYTDKNITDLNTPVVYYRIKQVDFDGNYSYTNEVAIAINAAKGIIHSMVVPNPFVSQFAMVLNSSINGAADVKITDMSGRVLVDKTVEVSKGASVLEIPESVTLSNGIYFLKTTINGQVLTHKLIKTQN